MSREIKFRAWDGSEYTLLDYKKDGIYLCGSFKDLQQYTGHMDGDGNEIYDGDIKEWRFNYHIWVSVCYWSDVDWGFRWKRVKHNEKFENYEDEYETEEIFEEAMKRGCQRSVGFDRWSKIIGNIYENPELMEG